MANLEAVKSLVRKLPVTSVSDTFKLISHPQRRLHKDGGSLIRQTVKHDYSNFLPSMNLRVALDDKQTVRLGVAQTMSRPRMDEMNASFSIGIGQVPDIYGNYIGAGGGNTTLEPKEALGIDLTYENYFADDGYFSIALYHKDLEGVDL